MSALATDLLSYFRSFLVDQVTDNHGLLTGRKLSRVSIKNYLSDTRKFLYWYSITSRQNNTNYPTPTSFLAYKHFLLSSSIPSATVNRHLSSLRRFGTFLSIAYSVPNPTLNLLSVTQSATPNTLSASYHNFL